MKLITILLLLLPLGEVFAQHQHGTKSTVPTPAKKPLSANSKGGRVEYHLYVNDTLANISGKKKVSALAMNGQIPAPTLHFTEGDTAVIHVHNLMHHETSIHWHGLLLPNKEDGVPYLTTAPVEPGGQYTFTFPLIQSGTFWYHSHTMLQEQSGLYGSIVIQPRKKNYEVDREFVLLLSDWTDENPRRVLNALKRNDPASEWYSIKKGYAQSLDKLIQHKGLGNRLKNGWKRMPPMDLSDVYYAAFLANGKRKESIPDLKPGDKVRLRVINGSASTYFYLHGGAGKLELISSDGIDVKPIKIDRLLMGIAETYDFLLTVPKDKTMEFRATAQDVSGFASLFLGKGDTLSAAPIPRPNVWNMDEMMMSMAVNFPDRMNHSAMGMGKMDHSKMNMEPSQNKQPASKTEKGHEGMDMDKMDHSKMNMEPSQNKQPASKTEKGHQGMDMDKMDHSKMNMEPSQNKQPASKTEKGHQGMDMDKMDHSKMNMDGMQMGKTDSLTIFNYDLLSATQKSTFDSSKPVRTVHLKLTGSMFRYVWSINNRVLSQADKISIKKGEIVRFELENTTMMNHPMHLHGHYFRVLNKNEDFSPLKHTLDVPPMTSITIEFDATEEKDWFFHCHILYHMMSGMARIVEYQGSSRDTSLARYPLKNLLKEDKMWFFYGSIAAKSHMAEAKANFINRSSAIRFEGNYNYGSQYEANISYERYIGDWLRPYIGFGAVKQRYYNIFNGEQTFEQDFDLPVIGVRYTLPFFIDADLRVNSNGRVRFALEGEEWLLPKLFFNWRINTDKEYHLDLEYMLGKYISLSGGYDSRYKLGGGLLVRF
ncbi:CopA family copper-resistance protein [Dyadobacter sp. BE34]|uniref:CopA family copper-resistance protein n=1 Tax=Dyadobacter fermentans TaxID=94254 RepID=A0ABU1R8M4_9BACT|nr:MULTISPECIES: multicopper oxidase domain-containing protein [Dyadobacter]MDR6809713.1 CopA family copper-resistance protein [Dyadobacter fermentans]MDR7047465.1 CopA family copper-resistance protein [Dyadobacter sp. BE242]MDR7201635.1 CopA family copper-resistance protein [Dyadobacter sp. BE34]MDR7219505.1 CopA family copper-resistance protein [Dyadobacter sp. BE31]MDR7267272.1 CopA family copper-resistance protein [Dyadobacter sp. BE32]